MLARADLQGSSHQGNLCGGAFCAGMEFRYRCDSLDLASDGTSLTSGYTVSFLSTRLELRGRRSQYRGVRQHGMFSELDSHFGLEAAACLGGSQVFVSDGYEYGCFVRVGSGSWKSVPCYRIVSVVILCDGLLSLVYPLSFKVGAQVGNAANVRG